MYLIRLCLPTWYTIASCNNNNSNSCNSKNREDTSLICACISKALLKPKWVCRRLQNLSPLHGKVKRKNEVLKGETKRNLVK